MLVNDQTVVDHHLVGLVDGFSIPSRRCEQTERWLDRRNADDLTMCDNGSVGDLSLQSFISIWACTRTFPPKATPMA